VKSTRFIPYGKQSISDRDIASVVEVLKSDWITQGPTVSKFEQAFSVKLKAPWSLAISSGTAALHLSCLVQELKPQDEVLVPAVTFIATANAVVYAGARPRIVDIDPKTGNICADDILRKINKRTRGIIPVHFGGNPADMNRIRQIANKYKLFIVEDSCHALGASYEGEPPGPRRESDLSVFSFHPVKHITTGEGGMITGKSKRFRNALLKLRNHGITKNPGEFQNSSEGDWYYEQQELGYNYRITDFQCALGISQLKRLDEFVAKRRKIAERYRRAFKNSDLIECLDENPKGKSSYHLFVGLLVLVNLRTNRKVIFQKLREKGIGVQVHYIPLHFQPFYQDLLSLKAGDFPNAENFYERAISLPIYPLLTEKEQDYVIESVLELLNKYKS